MSADSGAIGYYGFEFSSRSGASPQLNASQRCFKLTIIIVNVLFLLFGCISCALGAYAVNSQAGMLAGAGLPNAIIAIGVFIIIMALMGCAAAWFETRLGLSIYFIVLLILCLLSFLLGIGVLVEKNEARSLLVSGWRSSPSKAQAAVGDAFQCCGFSQFCDQCTCESFPGGPFTSADCSNQQCTGSDNNRTLCDFFCPANSQRGTSSLCLDVLQDSFESHYQQLGGASIAFGVLMFIAMAIVCVLMRGIKQKAYLEEVRAQHRRIREAKEERMIDLTGIQTGLEAPRYGNQSNYRQANQQDFQMSDDDEEDDLEEAQPSIQMMNRSSQPTNQQFTQPQRAQPVPQYDDEDLESDDDEEDYPPRRPNPSNNQSNNQPTSRPPPPASRAPPPRGSRRPPSNDEDSDDEDFS